MIRPAPKCFVCSSNKAWFGYGPPGWPAQVWSCASHRWEAELLRVKTAAELALEQAATKSGHEPGRDRNKNRA